MRELVDAVDAWAADRLDARALDHDKHIPSALIEEVAEMGLFGLTLPEAHGGLGLGLSGGGAVVRALARHDRSVATTVGLHAGLGTRGLVAFGSEEQHARWIPGLASGEHLAAFATTEPEAGSDLEAITTRAVAGDDGRLAVDGAKIYVTNGALASVYTLTVRTPGLGGRRATGLLVLEKGDDGVFVGPEEDKLGLRASSTTSLHIDGCTVDPDRLLGEQGKGAAQLGHVLAWGRTLMASGCIGTADAALLAARAHVAERRQFGKPLSALEVVQRQIADMSALRLGMEGLIEWTAASETDGDLVFRSTVAKVMCSDGAWEIIDTALQLHGGCGYIEETGIPLLLRDARVTRIFEGANDVLLGHLGAQELARPVDDGGVGPAAEYREALKTRFGVRAFRRQADLHRLGTLVAWRDLARAGRRVAHTEQEHAAADWLAGLALRRAAAVGDIGDPAAAAGLEVAA